MSATLVPQFPRYGSAAVLIREIPVRVLDLSGSGCLLETDCEIAVGTAVTLRLTFEGGEYVDDVEVCRCQAIAGAGSTHHVGVRFLWTTMPHERSIRRAIAQVRSLVFGNASRVN